MSCTYNVCVWKKEKIRIRKRPGKMELNWKVLWRWALLLLKKYSIYYDNFHLSLDEIQGGIPFLFLWHFFIYYYDEKRAGMMRSALYTMLVPFLDVPVWLCAVHSKKNWNSFLPCWCGLWSSYPLCCGCGCNS